MPLGLPSVPFSFMILVPYMVKTLHAIVSMFRARWREPDELDFNMVSIFHEWLLEQFLDLYTGWATCISSLERWPTLLTCAWLVTMVIDSVGFSCALYFRGSIGRYFYWILLGELVLEDLLQVMLML